jgi:hypothetical protein
MVSGIVLVVALAAVAAIAVFVAATLYRVSRPTRSQEPPDARP